MAQKFFIKFTFVALAVFAGACAQKRVEVEHPSQPDTTTQLSEEARVIERAEEIKRERAEKQAQREIKKADTPDMRQARREIAKERREEEKIAKVDRQIEERASVLGCGPETEVLNEKAEQKRGAFGRSAEVTLVNSSDIPWNVRTDSRHLGHIVKDLCVGGSLGIHLNRSFWQNWRESFQSRNGRRNTMETIVLVAIGTVIDENGKITRTVVRRFIIRFYPWRNEVSTTGVFELNGTYLPRVRRLPRP